MAKEKYRPKGEGEGRWPKMENDERSQLYGEIKKDLAGKLSKEKRRSLKKETHAAIASSDKNYNFPTTKVSELGKSPLSQALLNAFQQEKNLGGHSAKQIMFYALDYLQNGAENRGAGMIKNIDNVAKDDTIRVSLENGRWAVVVCNKDNELVQWGYLFPAEGGKAAATGAEPAKPVEEPSKAPGKRAKTAPAAPKKAAPKKEKAPKEAAEKAPPVREPAAKPAPSKTAEKAPSIEKMVKANREKLANHPFMTSAVIYEEPERGLFFKASNKHNLAFPVLITNRKDEVDIQVRVGDKTELVPLNLEQDRTSIAVQLRVMNAYKRLGGILEEKEIVDSGTPDIPE